MKVYVKGSRPNRLWGYDLKHPKYQELKEEIKRKLIEFGCTDLYTVMDLGTDTLAAIAIYELKQAGLDLKLHCILGYKDKDILWNAADRELFHNMLENADEVVYLTEGQYEPELVVKENNWLVDNCDMGIFVINSDNSKTGSRANETLEYAKYQEKPVHVIDIGLGVNKQRKAAENAKKRQKAGIDLDTLELWKNAEEFIVLDLETTGFSYEGGSKIIDIGAFGVSGNNIVSRYEQLVNPGEPIPFHITKLTSINDIMVKTKPDIVAVMPVLLKYVGDKTVIFHNSDFDYGKFIKPIHDTIRFSELNWNVLCTLKMDRFLRPDVKSHKLGDVYLDLTGDKSLNNAHRASTDALMTARIAVMMRDYIRANYEIIKHMVEEEK